MLQDVMNKRRTEIDVINGAIVKEGEKVGISTPANKVVTNLISVIQQNYKSK
jgi:2-dehydropantoate 2-reductase